MIRFKKPIPLKMEHPPEVSPASPLEGLEIDVLKRWLESSPRLNKVYQSSPLQKNLLENAVRLRVHAALVEETELRADGLTPEQAKEFTRPSMWTPPTVPKTPTRA